MSNYVKSTLDYHVSKLSLPPAFENNDELGLSMRTTYRIATCDDGKTCRKGDHIIESLAARAYNLALSATLLSAVGLYDESLNSVRSLGELANVLAYLSLHPDDYPNWVLADKKTRLSKYSPSAIRTAIEKSSEFEPPMDKTTYAELCELSTHVHGGTAPNAYGVDGRRHAGGFSEENGAGKVADLLTNTMYMIALLASKMVRRDDLFDEVASLIRIED
ncbi:hypothetical protein [Rhizobium sp. BK376]|uniref:hypothetical protein n=1 Tax=Rhizobium sp. BK376 TaxID=2512149 RepID=UPI001044E19B|nr:hypothetical protein [Rhizobium sp. BK376]TCR76783.1 hypothetical protein EV561_11943 [Rhizobium sp. BK376]